MLGVNEKMSLEELQGVLAKIANGVYPEIEQHEFRALQMLISSKIRLLQLQNRGNVRQTQDLGEFEII